MPGGERIGEAYVRILADGTGLDRSIRDQFGNRDVDAAIKDMGARGSDLYNESFAKQNSKPFNQKIVRESFANTLAKGDWLADKFFDSPNWRTFRKGMATNFGSAGRLATEHFQEGLESGRLDFSSFTREIEDLRPALARAYDRIDKDREAAYAEHNRRILAEFQSTIGDQDKAYDLHIDGLRRQDEQRLADFQSTIDRQEKAYELHIDALRRQHEAQQEWQRLGVLQERAQAEERSRSIKALREDYALLNREVNQLAAGDDRALAKSSLVHLHRNIRVEMDRLGFSNKVWNESLDDTHRLLVRTHPHLSRMNHNMNLFANTAGRAFGRGARNDFIHGIGVVTRGMIQLAFLPVRAAGAMITFASAMTQTFKAAAETGGWIAGLGAVFRSLILTVLKTGPAIVGMFVALTAAMTIITSAVSGLVGIFASLAATAIYAATAGVGSLAAVLLPLGAGAVVAAAAFLSLDDAAKKALSIQVKPLTNEFKALGEAAQSMFRNVPEQVARLVPIISRFRDGFRDVGRAISDVADGWIDMMSGEGFRAFQDAMNNFLPNAVRTLGLAFGQFLGGLGGLFRGMVPFMQQALDYIFSISSRFSEWANSAAGQNQIMQFFADAADSARSFWNFLREVGSLLGEILSAGRETGDTIFDRMADALARATEYLRKNPKALQDWFGNAKELAGDVGKIVVAMKDLFDALDSETGRWAAGGIFSLIGDGIRELAQTFGTINDAVDSADRHWKTMTDTMKSTSVGVLPTWKAFLGGIRDGIHELTGPMGTFSGAWDVMRDSWAKFPASSRGVEGALSGMAGTLDQVTGAATRATRELALLALQQNDTIDQARQFGISARDLISASLGHEGAIKRVNTALKAQPGLLKGLTAGSILGDIARIGDEFDENGNRIRENSRAVEESRQALTTWGQALKGIESKKLRVDVKTLGMDLTLRDLKDLNKQYDLTPKEIRTIVKATNLDLTKKELNALITQLTGIDKKKTNPKVDADTKTAEQKLKEVVRQADLVNKLRPKPKADVDATPANNKFTALFATSKKYDALKPEALARLKDDATKPLLSIQDKLGTYGRTSKDAKVGVNNQASGPLLTIFGQLANLRDKTITVRTQYISSGATGGAPRPTASGALVNGAQVRLIGEAGPEAVVPLNRPLGLVDPAVRALSAFAQGLRPPTARGGVFGATRTIDASGWTIVTPSADSRAVAASVVNRLAATGY